MLPAIMLSRGWPPSEDHQINYLQGLALHEGTIYLVGNVVIQQGVSGYGKAVKAKITSGKMVWTEIFKTAEHASSKDTI
jgi:hypothetical protein